LFDLDLTILLANKNRGIGYYDQLFLMQAFDGIAHLGRAAIILKYKNN
jgi:hypothetical protein